MFERVRRFLMGAPKDVRDPGAYHKMSLVALLAWIGLGADGLSSSSYGPDESFRSLGEHTGLAVFLAAATALTVFIISYGYSRIIEQFPSGGGGYIVASKLLGPRIGVVSGSALLVDYVLTITMSIASGADAIFSFLPPSMLAFKLAFAFVGLATLTLMNLRGVKESVSIVSPIFAVFLVTHAALLLLVLVPHSVDAPRVASEVHANVTRTVTALGIFGTLKLFMRAYSMGGGTYTGIEAVSNGIGIMREPRVATAKRTMVLLATSLAITAGGILFCYLLVHASPEPGKTMNAVLVERVASSWRLWGMDVGHVFIIVTLFSEGALLFVAAQTGFVDGPRVMANMAIDRWFPARFASLSERLTMINGVILMSAAAVAVLIYTKGDVSRLVVMYAINVFLTFSLSNIAMIRHWVQNRKVDPKWYKHLPAHVVASVLCVSILCVTITEKFTEGAWLTMVVTALLTLGCFSVRRHYDRVAQAIRSLDVEVPEMQSRADTQALLAEPRREAPVAALFVGPYSGLGRHALLTLLRMFPDHFEGVVFLSIAVVDSDVFKGPEELKAIEERTLKSLQAYENFAHRVGLPATSMWTEGIEVPVQAEKLAKQVLAKYPRAMFVAGQIMFDNETFWTRMLHNETAITIQHRLQHAGAAMVVLPMRLSLEQRRVVLEPS